ncbi:MAG: mannosyl-3-phosphoglycerate phosphatase [Thalassolituus sp.]|jgi:mannosyl-3-phosphoglycerate phosphatase
MSDAQKSDSINTEQQVPIVILTDLDGTLLDHHNYSTTAAKETLALIKEHKLPLIFNTSKTQAEVTQLRRQLDNTSPYVCENGSALYYPDETGQMTCLVPGASYDTILKVLSQLRKDGFHFRGFNDMTDTEVAAVTGLSTDDAYLAKQRAATEPLLWQGSVEELAAFQAALTDHNLRLLEGGRFYHVMGRADKAEGVSFFRDFYHKHWQSEPTMIALGDGGNDVAMLEVADFPIIIPGDKRTITVNNTNAVTADFKGPKGWNQILLPLLQQLIKENCGG